MYYDTPSLEECKECALLHKTVRDDRLFLRFLVRFEMLGYYRMHKLMRACPWMRRVDMEDIKHTVILGILKAFDSVKPSEPPRYLPLRVMAYVNHELNSTYKYLKKEEGKMVDVDWSFVDILKYTAVNPKIDAIMFVTSDLFTEQEQEMLRRRYVLGESNPEISAAMGNIGALTVCRKLQKLRDIVAGFLQNDGVCIKKTIRHKKIRKSVTTSHDTNSLRTGESR